jgi:hypothetical protein
VAVWCILWLFGVFYPVLVCFTNKNLATLIGIPLYSFFRALFPIESKVAAVFVQGKCVGFKLCHRLAGEQGCQIFLGTKNQKGGWNVPKLPQKYQMAIQ